MEPAESLPVQTLEAWQTILRRFKEKLAQRLWAIPSISESEKELVFREYLSDLNDFEKELASFEEGVMSREKLSQEENGLLRSIMGVSQDDLKMRLLSQGNDLAAAMEQVKDLSGELDETKQRLIEADDENAELRRRVHELEGQSDQFRVEQLRLREDDVKTFGEAHEGLKTQLKDLESRLANLRELFSQSNQKLLTEKQDEISILQKSLLDEMETALRRKQELVWSEQEMFAKGVAHRVRTALVSAQGQLMLTLERLGLLDPETKTEAFWKARLRLLIEGAGSLGENFRAIQAQLQEVTSALDDYLHLTHRREVTTEPVSLKELAQKEIAEVYVERRPTLSVELLPDDPLPAVMGDPSLLGFALRTLVQNAIESLPDGAGKIVVAIKNLSAQGRVQVWVRDSGPGIPPHLVPRIFQPFFSTKEHRQGLSLSRAKKYAELHGGSLTLIQTGPEGTIFQMELPLSLEKERR